MPSGQRNLLETWCPMGSPLTARLSSLRGDKVMALQRLIDRYVERNRDEVRAAVVLAACTDAIPNVLDVRGESGGQQGSADLELLYDDGVIDIAEVTATIDSDYMVDHRGGLDRLLRSVNRIYEGTWAWGLMIDASFTWPNGKKQIENQAQTMAARLHNSERGSLDLPVAVEEGLIAQPIAGRQAGIYWSSSSARVPDPGEQPYLERLEVFLEQDANIAKHIAKLKSEAVNRGAHRRHLYLLMASTGTNGHLLPASPGLFGLGEFVAPDGVDNLWLDGGTGEIYHWSAEQGWMFHPWNPVRTPNGQPVADDGKDDRGHQQP